MPSRESQVAERLRADATLTAILTGGIYRDATLGDEGITNRTTTPDAYSGGLLQPCAIVRQRAMVPGRRVHDEAEQVTDANQVVEVHLYQRGGADQIEAAQERIYALLQGWQAEGAYPADWNGGAAVMDAPEFVGVRTARIDFLFVSLRQPA